MITRTMNDGCECALTVKRRKGKDAKIAVHVSRIRDRVSIHCNKGQRGQDKGG